MTILTKTPTQAKNEKPVEVLVYAAALDGGPDTAADTDDVESDPAAATVVNRRRAASRASVCLQTFLFLFGLSAIVVGFIGAHRIVSHLRRPRLYHGVCGLPQRMFDDGDHVIEGYSFEDGDFKSGAGQDVVEVKDASLTMELTDRGARGLEVDYELDLDLEEFEAFQLPKLSASRYLHDFGANMTGIVDMDNDRCFVMPLDRDEVPKPRSFYDLMNLLNNGAFDLDVKKIRHDYRVVTPAIENDIEELGIWIFKACYEKPVYRLEKAEDLIVVKRSAEPQKKDFQFVEYVGDGLLQYNIVNLDDI